MFSPKDFEATYPASKRFYRGVNSAAGAAHTREGGLGRGDFGRAVYTDKRITTAQTYTGTGEDGRVMRLALARGTKIMTLPERVSRRGREAIERWAEHHDPDVFVDWLGLNYMVRRPEVLIIDSHNYTKRESVVLYMLDRGFSMPDGYQSEIQRLRELLGITIPDEGQIATH